MSDIEPYRALKCLASIASIEVDWQNKLVTTEEAMNEIAALLAKFHLTVRGTICASLTPTVEPRP